VLEFAYNYNIPLPLVIGYIKLWPLLSSKFPNFPLTWLCISWSSSCSVYYWKLCRSFLCV